MWNFELRAEQATETWRRGLQMNEEKQSVRYYGPGLDVTPTNCYQQVHRIMKAPAERKSGRKLHPQSQDTRGIRHM